MESTLSYLQELNIVSMMLRVVLAMLMGGIIGFERERNSHPAGFRTYMLVAVGASLTVMLSQYLDVMLTTVWAETAAEIGIKTDVSRFGAQVINGVGFLGAGTIIVTSRQEVRGLTTAAGLWASACLGLAIGAGFYACMIVGVVLILLCLEVLPFVENFINARSRNCNIYVELDSIENLGNIVNRLKADGVQLYDVEIDKETVDRLSQVNAVFSLYLPASRQHAELLAEIATLDGIISIEEV